jgi:tetratricopeptide (TPR) repeat protein
LYWKRLLIVAAAAVAFGGTVFAVHRLQVKSQSSVLKEQAERAAAEVAANPAKRGEAVELLRKYLKFRPDDEDAFQKFAGLLFDEVAAGRTGANMEAAARGVEEFLRAFPNHPAERQKLVKLYLSTGQFSKLPLAKLHLEMVFASPDPKYRASVEALEMAAECEFGLGNLPEAIRYIEEAIKTGAAPVRTYVRAMELHYGNKGDPKRNTHIDDHLRALRGGRFGRDREARVAAARFEMFLGNSGPAAQDLKFAFDALGGGSDPAALLAAAELELKGARTPAEAKAKRERAEALLRKAFAIDGKNVAVGMLLAEVVAAQGKLADGVKVLKQTADSLGQVDDHFLMVVDRLIDLGEKDHASALVESRLAPDEGKKVIVAYFRGRLAVLRQDWQAALRLLEESEAQLGRVPLYHKKAMVGVAACYAAMQNPDKQLEYCRKALRDDGGYPPAVVGEAEALVRMGKVAEAVRRYRTVVYEFHINGYRNELARLELMQVLSRAAPGEGRSWERFDESLGPPESRTPELHILNAESLVARGRAAEAAKLLEGWLAGHPKDPKAPAVWVALARVTDGGKPAGAWATLAAAEKQLGDAVEFRLARAATLVAQAKPAAPADFEALAAGAEKFPQADRFRLLSGLGQSAARVADRVPEAEAAALRAGAINLLRAAAALSPRDLYCRAMLLDQAISARREDVIGQALKEMAAVEGENGPVGALARIAVRLPEVKRLTDKAARAAGAAELRALANHVRELRPGWSRIYIALAQLDELEGLNDAALDNYRLAIEKGDRQEFVVRRAVDLYRLAQQDEKAVGLLDRLSTEVRLPDDLERYRSIFKMLAQDLPRESRPTIDRIAPASSTNYRLMLLRGSLLAAIRADEDALKAFRRAVELADTTPETWASLVAQLVKSGRPGDAKRAVAEAEGKLTAAAPARPEERAGLNLALGGLREMVGDLKGALAAYDAACTISPTELDPTRQRILFFQRTGQGDRAAKLLEEAAHSSAQNVARWARRRLAITLVARPDAYAVRKQALALVDQNLAAAPDDPEDQKARAVVLIVDPLTRDDGVRALRHFDDRGELTPDEHFLLGQVAFDRGKYPEAEKYFKLAARLRPGVTAAHMAAVVRVYLALGLLDKAEGAVERLKTYHPGSWDAAREEARLLARKGKEREALGERDGARKLLDQARDAVRKYPGWDAVPNLAARTGPLFEEIGLPADAEAAYKKLLAEDKSPGAHFPLARFYIVQKQSEKAIRLARDREKGTPVLLTARLLTGAVRAKRPEPTAEAEIERWLDAALRDAAGKPELEAALIAAKAELLDAQGQYDEAVAEYRRSLATHKSDLAVNNLAMLLALTQSRGKDNRAEEAVKMMSELIAIRGPVPSFLDTRAVAYLVSSRPAEAKKDLDMALAQYDRAVYRFHLAWALDLDGEASRRVFAGDELGRAKRLGLTAADLHPLELPRYAELFPKYRVNPN